MLQTIKIASISSILSKWVTIVCREKNKHLIKICLKVQDAKNLQLYSTFSKDTADVAAAAVAQTTLPLDFEYDKNGDRKRFDEACAKFFSPEESEHLFTFVTPPRRQRFLRKEYKKLIKVVDQNRKIFEKGLPKDVGPIGYAVVSNAPSTLATIMETTVRVLYFEVELLKIIQGLQEEGGTGDVSILPSSMSPAITLKKDYLNRTREVVRFSGVPDWGTAGSDVSPIFAKAALMSKRRCGACRSMFKKKKMANPIFG